MSFVVVASVPVGGFRSIPTCLSKTCRSRFSVKTMRFNLHDDIFSPKSNHPTTFDHDPPFAYKPLNDPAIREGLLVGSRSRLSDIHTRFFEKQMLSERAAVSPARLAHALSLAQCLDSKELFESLEFYLRVRRRIRQPLVIDLACGHGLCGLLFAALEPAVEAVALVDSRRPRSFDAVLAAVATVAPWVPAKVHFLEQDLYGLAAPCRPGVPSSVQRSPHSRRLPRGGAGPPRGGVVRIRVAWCSDNLINTK